MKRNVVAEYLYVKSRSLKNIRQIFLFECRRLFKVQNHLKIIFKPGVKD